MVSLRDIPRLEVGDIRRLRRQQAPLQPALVVAFLGGGPENRRVPDQMFEGDYEDTFLTLQPRHQRLGLAAGQSQVHEPLVAGEAAQMDADVGSSKWNGHSKTKQYRIL